MEMFTTAKITALLNKWIHEQLLENNVYYPVNS